MAPHPGFRFTHSQCIGEVEIRSGAPTTVHAGQERIAADAYVLALGVESTGFARQTGFRLPLYLLKGYSITVPLIDSTNQSAAPQVSITDLYKIFCARLANRLRVAGRVELVGMDHSVSDAAIDESKRDVEQFFPGCGDPSDNQVLLPCERLPTDDARRCADDCRHPIQEPVFKYRPRQPQLCQPFFIPRIGQRNANMKLMTNQQVAELISIADTIDAMRLAFAGIGQRMQQVSPTTMRLAFGLKISHYPARYIVVHANVPAGKPLLQPRQAG